MDFPLSSSVILVIAVVLWIVWVAPYLLRNGRHQLQPVGELLEDVIDFEPADSQAGRVMKMTAQQEKAMTSMQRTESSQSTAGRDGVQNTEAAYSGFRIRYDRLALALAGVLSLLTGIVSGALRIFGIGSAWLPVLTMFGAVAAVVALRRLAVRDRHREVNAAFRAAMGASVHTPSAQSAAERTRAVPAAEAGNSRKRADSPVFDAQAGLAAPKPLTAHTLRQAALAEAAASGDTSVSAATGPAPLRMEGSSWEPVEVPRPTYVEAAKAARAAPQPLNLPEAPKAVGRPSLKQGASWPLASGSTTAGNPDGKPLGKAQSALSNLDDVLQRRRA